MIDLRRHLLGASLLLVALVLLLGYDFSERGRHFVPPAARAKTDRIGVYDLSRARMLTKVVGHVRSHYVDPERVEAAEMAVEALRSVQAQVPEVTVVVDRDGRGRAQALDVTVSNATKRFGLERVRDLFEFNWKLMDVFDFLQRHLPPTADLEHVEYSAVNGILSTLDPHSVLVSPQVYREMQLGTQGRFGGLGIVISVREGMLTVMSVMDGTPANRAGLRSGDRIVQIGEESTINMPLNDAVNRLRGEPGTPVTIWIDRKGFTAPKSYLITREEIRIRSVDHADLGDGIGYVKIRNFQGNTFDDLNESLSRLSAGAGGLKGLVIDLRENPGGLLEQAIRISDRFLADGTIVTTVRERGKEREERHATRSGSLADLPLVVLLNRGSASASEVVAGALKHNDRAIVLGSTSFGKGSVQVIYEIDDAALKLTIAQYLTPGDVSIQSVGIVPDIEIQPVVVDRERMDIYPDELESEGEAGLDAHLVSRRTLEVRPSVRLKLVDGLDAKEPAGDAKEGAAPSDDDGPGSDTLAQLAREILLAAPVADRDKALVQATGYLDRRQAQEDARVAEQLAALGIDWTRVAAKGKPRSSALTATLHAVPEGETGRARAGGKLRIEAAVTGEGRREVARVHGVISSDIAAVNGHEFVFGRVGLGQTRTWSVVVELPKSLATQADRLKLKLFADGVELPVIATADLEIDALPAPRFAYSARVRDLEGNRDGLVQRGEAFELAVEVTNVGAGPAHDLLVTVKNESGENVFIKQGRERLGELAVGASAWARFSLEVREGLKSQDVQLKLAIVDQGIRTWSQGDLRLPVFPTEFPAAQAGRGFAEVVGGVVRAHAGAHRDMPVVAELAEGARVPVLASAGAWREVQVAPEDGPEVTAWVLGEQLRGDAAGPATWERVTRLRQHEPPELLLDPGLSQTLLTSAESIPLTGRARFIGDRQGRRYVYIFRNEDKVFFRAADSNGDVLPFEARVPLVEGRNVLTVVSREGKDDVTRESVVVYRR